MQAIRAECVSEAGYYKKSQFAYERTLFDEDGELLPLEFNLVTANREISIGWAIKYAYISRPVDETTWLELCEIEISMRDVPVVDLEVYVVIFGESRDFGECVFISAKFDTNGPMRRAKKLKNIAASSLRAEIRIYCQDKSVQQMIDDYTSFLGDQETCDVIFVVSGEELPVHKQILSARGPVFASMLGCDMLEKKNARVEIPDIAPNVFRNLLHFVYCNRVETENVPDLLKLIVAADKYCVQSLISYCENRISTSLTVENVVEVLVVADLVKAEVLKRMCVSFILKHKARVIRTEGYDSLVRTNRTDLISMLFCQM